MTRAEFSNLTLGYLDDLLAYALRLTRDADLARDLVQDSFERAFGAWTELDDPARCRGWLFRIARNLHIDRRRAQTARPELRLVEPGDRLAAEPTLDPEQIERLDARILEKLLESLPFEQREAVLLHDIWGFVYEEIASITDSPMGTVRSRIARGRARLASELSSIDEVAGPAPAVRGGSS